MAPPLSPVCQKIANKIKALEHTKQVLADQLKKASTGMKADIAAQIKELNLEIAKKNKELKDCIKKNPVVPPPAPKPNPCKSIAGQISKLKTALDKEVQQAVAPLQELLKKASPDEKGDIAGMIKEKSADIRKNSQTAKKIATLQKEYSNCIEINGGLPALNATFAGTATLTTSNADAPGPFKRKVTVSLRFSEWDHRDISNVGFSPIAVTYDAGFPVGTVTTTVSLMGSTFGKFDPFANSITLPLELFFHHSTDLAEDSTLDITLVTTSPLTGAGKIAVSGSSKFKGGYLDDESCSLTVVGTISPHP